MPILKTIFAENYAVFADRIEFTCESVSNKKEHKNNTATAGGAELNLVSYIYGANGSGKSYLCKIFKKIQETLLFPSISASSPQHISAYAKALSNGIQPKAFAFDTTYQNKPTTLGIEIIINDIQYHYEFSILNNEIVSELLQRKKQRTEIILNRTSPEYQDIILKSELKEFEIFKKAVRRDSLCLAVAANLNNPFATELINTIYRIQVYNLGIPCLDPPDRELFSKEKIAEYTKILRHADPTIEKMQVEYKEEKQPKKTNSDDIENRELIDEHINVSVRTEHILFKNGKKTGKTTKEISFFNDESMGTIKLLTTLPYLFDVLEKGDVLVLDEIDNGLHPNVVKEIISLFLDKKRNPKDAQLICTTHQPLLLDDSDAKRDQVWIMSKDPYGKSTIDRLSNLPSARNQSNLSNKIVEGALGCNPDSFFGN